MVSLLRFFYTDVFDTQTKQWHIRHLSVARAELAAASLGQYCVFAGGVSSGPTYTYYSTVDVFDVSTGMLLWRMEMCSF